MFEVIIVTLLYNLQKYAIQSKVENASRKPTNNIATKLIQQTSLLVSQPIKKAQLKTEVH